MKIIGSLVAIVFSLPTLGLEIVIDRGTDNPTTIAVVPFSGSGGGEISATVSFDLFRSGLFATLNPDNMLSLPASPSEVGYRDWRIQQMQYLTVGRISSDGNSVRYHLISVDLERVMFSREITIGDTPLRDIAHYIADEIFEEITGVPGAFSTKILYVAVENGSSKNPLYRLLLADSDGERPRAIFESAQPLLGPSWSPDGEKVAYVSFERGSSAVYEQELLTGIRTKLADFEGVNSAPAYSPDGKTLAMALSRDGNLEIYTMNIESRALRRITSHWSIDTEPTWANDGKKLIYTSDRGGHPQIYEVNLRTLVSKRLTMEGDYNARPQILADDKHLVFVHRRKGRYHVAWQQIGRPNSIRVLTDSQLDESPSVAPNGSMLMYATKDGRKGILAIVSIDGQVRFKLPSDSGDVMEPAWSPYLRTAVQSRSLWNMEM